MGGLSKRIKLDTRSPSPSSSPSPSPSPGNNPAHNHLKGPFPEYCREYTRTLLGNEVYALPTPPTDAWPSEGAKTLQYTAVDS